MASHFSAEDQTDEDFFDKLVEEEFPSAQPIPKNMARESSNSNLSTDSDAIDTASTGTEPANRLSNLSLDEKDLTFEKSEISNLDDSSTKDSTFEKLQASNPTLVETETPNKLVPSSISSSNNESLEKKGEELGLGFPSSPVEKSSTGSKSISVKQVTWNAFGSAFGSELDPFSNDGFENPDFNSVENPALDQFGTQSLHAVNNNNINNTQFYPNQDLSQSFYSERNESEFFNSSEPVQTQTVQTESEPAQTESIQTQTESESVQADPNEISNWENQYPGWKYDYATGQWYQVDNFDTNSNSNAQFDDSNSNSNLNSQFDNLSLQQSTHAVLETIAEESTGTVNGLTGTEYPPNMIFDPNYPGWYYDTNTQEWYSLESYNPVPVQESGTGMAQEQVNQNQTQLGQLLGSGYSGDWSSYTNPNPNPNQVSESFYGDNNNTENNNAVMSSFYGDQNQTSVQSSSNQFTTSSFYGGNNATSAQNSASFYGTNSTVGGNFAKSNANNQQLSGSFYGGNTAPSNQNFQFQPQPVNLGQFGQNNNNNLSDSFYGGNNQNNTSVNFNQKNVDVGPTQGNLSDSFYGNPNQNFANFNQSGNVGNYGFTPGNEGRSSAGRPPHALVTFGFGGKLVIMKDSSNSYASNFDFSNKGSTTTSGTTISILNISEIIKSKTDDPNFSDQYGALTHFKSLLHASFPGPLVGSSTPASKDVHKWLDDKIASCESPAVDSQNGQYLKLLYCLLKIFVQHYGKLRSPFGSDPSQQEADGPEMAVTKLFSSAKRSNYGSFGQCVHNIPSENQIRATALEVQNLLVSGKRKEALQLAQDGQLWGPALVLAAQLGNDFYAETVKKMAHRQFVLGSPLRTLCLLIAGQPADVFSTDNPSQSALGTPKYAVSNAPQSFEFQGGGMLDEWEENLAVMVANRTIKDELVMIHLGDCLWKEKAEVTAAHTCYLVAESNFEQFSDTARLCLVGADHWKCPRTFASPDAIQRTELYEYAKVLGNAQYMLLPFQPYKLVYAHMLAEMGKISDSLKYCQASLKLLKSSRAPELEALKQQFSSLEERIRTHQQGGFSSNAPTKIVKNLFSTLDRGIQRVMGTPAPPQPGLPPMAPTTAATGTGISNTGFVGAGSAGTWNENPGFPKFGSQSVSDSINEMDSSGGNNSSAKKSLTRQISSEPDFARSPKQDGAKGNETGAGGSKLGRIGSTLFGWIAKPKNQAKLGEENTFYYDEKLKRWVEKGAADVQTEAPPLAPPPTFQNNNMINNINNNINDSSIRNNETTGQNMMMVNGSPEIKPSVSYSNNNASEVGANAGMPPVPPSHNQFSNRGRIGVRSRYVDTFNKGGTGTGIAQQSVPPSQFHTPAVPTAIKPPANAKFFVPTIPAPSTDSTESSSEIPPVYNSPPPKQSSPTSSSNSSPPPPVRNYQNTPQSSIHRFPSMDNINKTPGANMGSGSGSRGGIPRTRAASWSGSFNDPLGGGGKFAGQMSPPNQFMPNNNYNNSINNNGSPSHDEFNEVEL
ncbi:hypothetical protein LUZ60_007365 [Juncus effusus]|nr:hypothetical protein LUZ60_007365 [Juncus effusus]